MAKKKDVRQKAYNVMFLLTGLLTVLVQAYKAEIEPHVLALFGLLAIVVIIYFIYIYVRSYFEEQFTQVSRNTKDILTLKSNFNYLKKFHEFDKRITMLESFKSKKGEIDPRLVMLIVLLIVFYFYLKAVGII